jgi:hypothetical protein
MRGHFSAAAPPEPLTSGSRLSFTLLSISGGMEGASHPVTGIRKGDATIVLKRMANCRLWGAPGKLSLQMDDCPESSLELTHSPLSPAVKFEGEGETAYKDVVKKVSGSSVEPESSAPRYHILNWKGRTFTVRSVLGGRVLFHEVTFMNVDQDQQVMITLVTPDQERNCAMALANRFLSSWRELSETPVTYN